MSSGRKEEKIRKKSRLISENDIADSRRRSTPERAAKTTEQSLIGRGVKRSTSPPPGADFPANSSPKSFSIFNSMNTCRARARRPLPKMATRESHRCGGSFCLARLITRALGRRRIEKSPIPLKVQRISGARCDFHPPHVTT